MSDGDVASELAEIHAGLEQYGYYVAPELEEEFSASQLAQLRSDLASTEQPTYVVAYPLRDTDAFDGSAADLLTRLHDAYPDPGVYLSATAGFGVRDDLPVRLEGRQYDVPGQRDGELLDYQVSEIIRLEEPDDLGAAFLRSVELLELDSASLSELAVETRDEARGPSDAGDGSGSAGPVVVLVVLVVLAAFVLVVVGRRRRGLPIFTDPAPGGRPPTRPGAGAGAPLTLPSTTLERIRDAHDRRLAEEARDEVLDLGVRIDRVRITTEAERAGWERAVEHYQGARDLLERLQDLDREPDVDDVTRARALVRRAQEALDTSGGDGGRR